MEDDRWAKKIDELRRQGLFRAVGHQPESLGAVERRARGAVGIDRFRASHV